MNVSLEQLVKIVFGSDSFVHISLNGIHKVKEINRVLKLCVNVYKMKGEEA